jgi:hypothetical protein
VGFPLLSARSIAIVASLVCTTCVLAAIPLAAFGDDTPATTGPSPEVAELLQVREEVEQVNELAQDQAPPAVGNTCNATLEVDGIGDTCVASDGLLRVEQADGRSHTIHGIDAPPVSANADFAPASQSAVNGAGVGDVTCVGAGQPHYTLVYAHPGNVGSRYGAIAPLLRNELYKVSAYIDSESRSVDPSAGRRLPVRCDGGSEPVVLQAALTGLSSGAASFGNIVDGLRAQGYQFNGDGAGDERYIVYYDSPSPAGAAGTGHVFTTDSSAGAGNQNNKGGLYSVEYRWATGGNVPHWEVMVHEVMHTMGSVVSDAPHSTPAGHCRDGQDIMCYDDSAASGYTDGVCSTKVLDCNRDDYFNPAPAPGSFLATHWNAAATYNAYLADYAGGVLTGGGSTGSTGDSGGTRQINGTTDDNPGGDGSGTSDVRGLRQSGASNAAVGISWRATAGARAYVVSRRSPGGTWRRVVTTTRTAAIASGLAAGTTYEIGVARRAASGQVGAPAVITVSSSRAIDRKAPTRPGRIKLRQRPGFVAFSWGASRDNVGVQTFELRRIIPTKRGRRVMTTGRTPNASLTIRTRGLRAGSRHRFELVARDAAGNVSSARPVTVFVRKDRTRPSRVARVRASSPTRSSVTLRWSASRDEVKLSNYVVTQKVGRQWTRVGKPLTTKRRVVRVTKLRPRSTYRFRVQGRDSSGNLSVPSQPVYARTR